MFANVSRALKDMLAADIGHLVRRKADVNAEDHTGNTPLHVMAGSWSYGLNPAVTRSLLGAGARKTCRGAHR